jgi:ribosomal protein L11 methylase PrmA
MRGLVLSVCCLIAAGSAAALDGATRAQIERGDRAPDVIFVPTPQEVVEDMLRLANIKKGDVLFDLGSGDGRIAVTAAKLYGIRAVGIDIDPERIREAQDNAKKNGVESLVQFRLQDLFEADFREATVVTLYLLPDLNLKLRPRLLAELKPGTRIVSHQFDMGDWQPAKKLESNGRTVYFWVVPERKKPRAS